MDTRGAEKVSNEYGVLDRTRSMHGWRFLEAENLSLR
jgi:hypothetical protein